MDSTSLLHMVVTAVVTALAPLVVGIGVQWLRKFNIQVSDAQQAQARQVVQGALLEAEEWAAARIKAKLPATGHQKLERALQMLSPQLPKVSESALASLVHAELPKLGLGASGTSF